MEQGPLRDQIVGEFDAMSTQLQRAARYVLDHPEDVALLSMREQARHAGVQPATMMRLAKHLGLGGYEEMRDRYAAIIRGEGMGFAGRAGAQVASQKLNGDRALAREMVKSIGRQMDGLAAPDRCESLSAASAALAGARRIFCLGLRSSYPVAWHFHYILSLLGETSTFIDGGAGTSVDPMRNMTTADALLAVSVMPYTRLTVEAAQYAALNGISVIAITDSSVAPLAQIARHTVVVPTDSPSFFHTMTPAFAVAEILASLVAGHGGEAALETLKRTDEQAAAFNIHLDRRFPMKTA
ncbi:MAG: MurR/RpiR family transcriptional regulator [Rhizobiaceae bacterium]